MVPSIVKYEVPRVEKQISLFKYFLEVDEKFRNALYLEYPGLKEQKLEIYVTTLYQSKGRKLKGIRDEAQESWNKIEGNILTEFTNILHKDWDIKTIPGGISLLPFSTRDLKEKRFDVYYKKDIQGILKTTTHELFHFIFFDKWKDIFPNTTIEEMDYPNPIWALSEIALPIMLNNSNVVNILDNTFKNYGMFENEVFNGGKIICHIEDLYKSNGVEDFLQQSSEYITTYYEWKNNNKV